MKDTDTREKLLKALDMGAARRFDPGAVIGTPRGEAAKVAAKVWDSAQTVDPPEPWEDFARGQLAGHMLQAFEAGDDEFFLWLAERIRAAKAGLPEHDPVWLAYIDALNACEGRMATKQEFVAAVVKRMPNDHGHSGKYWWGKLKAWGFDMLKQARRTKPGKEAKANSLSKKTI